MLLLLEKVHNIDEIDIVSCAFNILIAISKSIYVGTTGNIIHC